MGNWIKSKSHAAGCIFLCIVSFAGLIVNGCALHQGKQVNMLYMVSMAVLGVASLLWLIDFFRKARKKEKE